MKLKKNGTGAMAAGKYKARLHSHKHRFSGDIRDIMVLVCHMIL